MEKKRITNPTLLACGNAMKHIFNLLMLVGIVVVIEKYIIEEVWYKNEAYSFGIVVFLSLIGIAVYAVWLSKIYKELFRTSISLVVFYVFIRLFILLSGISDTSVGMICAIIALCLVALVVAVKLNEMQHFVSDTIITKLENTVMYVCKFSWIYIISLAIGIFIQGITEIPTMVVPIPILCIYVLDYIWNRKQGKTKQHIGIYVWITIAIMVLLAIGWTIVYDRAEPVIAKVDTICMYATSKKNLVK